MSSVLNSNHNSGINFLLSLETRGIKLGLKRTRELLKCCDNPQNNLKSIQIIGTNGKGSTAATLSSILLESGMNVGMYTSPHLVHLSERIQINGLQISNDDINSFINNFKTDIENLECTFFETMTALAMFHFYNNNIDFENLNNSKVIDELTTIKGVGSWTAEMFLIFILFRENIFSKKDIALLNSIKLNYNIENLTDKRMNNLIDSWAPYNTFASLLLWKSIEENIIFKEN